MKSNHNIRQLPVLHTQVVPLEMTLPEDETAETGVIACLLNQPGSVGKVVDWLVPEDFYHSEYRLIFESMMRLHRRGKLCNSINVTYDLRKRGNLDEIGSHDILVRISDRFPDVFENVLDHAEKVREVAFERRCAEFAYKLYIGACQHAIDPDSVEQEFAHIMSGASNHSSHPPSMSETMMDYVEEVEKRRENFANHIANGVPTGFSGLDRILGGLQPGELNILAARPSIGKSALSTNIALNIARQKRDEQQTRHVLFFSLEMKRLAIAQRLVAMESPMDQTFLRDGDMSDEQFERVVTVAGNLSQARFEIDDQSFSIPEIKRVAREIHARDPLDVIVVDYLQFAKMSADGRGKNETRSEEVARMSRELKELAKTLNVSVLALAQLNRAIETRGDKTPVLSDLKESGGIEQDADVVMFLHCSDQELQKRFKRLPYIVTVVVAKNREGGLAQIDLTFKPRSTKFVEIVDMPMQQEDDDDNDDDEYPA